MLGAIGFGSVKYFLANKVSNTPQVTEEAPLVKAHLEIFSQPVSVTPANSSEKVTAVDKQEINPGDKITTEAGGKAQIVYPTGTETRIDENSEMTLKEFNSRTNQTKVNLGKGRIWSRIVKLLGIESYSTETSTMVATVRGTSYGLQILPNGQVKLITLEGAVQGDCTNNTETGTVRTSQKAQYACATTGPVTIIPLEQNDLTDAWIKFNIEQDKLQEERFGQSKFTEEVLGTSTENTETDDTNTASGNNPAFNPAPLIDCLGPDGKFSRVTQSVCNSVLSFWVAHQPPPPPYQQPNSSNSGSSSPVTDNSPTITSVSEMSCGSSSCSSITTLKVNGTNYNFDARVQLSALNGSLIYKEPTGAQLVSHNGTTEIITDFYNVNHCTTYDVTVYFPAPDTRVATSSAAFSSFCPNNM